MVRVVKPDVTLSDAVKGLNSLEAGSAALVLSDLPSGKTQASFDTKPDLAALWRAIWRVCKPNAVVCLMASAFDFACDVKMSQPQWFRYDLIWKKSLATGFLNANTRPLRSHEFVLVFWKKPGSYTSQMLEVGSPIHAATRTSNGENYGKHTKVTKSRAGCTDRFPTSVMEFSSVGTSAVSRVHPQQKPVDMLRWLVRSYSSPGDLVVDPYAGSGSTGAAARAEGRKFIGFDSDPRFGRKVIRWEDGC